ncbi:MAG: hypothetical protein KOO62_08750 [candidate division Zixibacteria bacterium]|nr:hypothetical protein [candidate division Zixibacteria bacterium]
MHFGESASTRPLLAAIIAYNIMLIAFFVASFFPETRIWGFNQWAYFPLWIRAGVLGLGVLAGMLVLFWKPSNDDRTDETSDPKADRNYLLISISLVIVAGVLFYFFRARTHFLGDGYTVLSLLAADEPLIKSRELGEAYAHIWLKNMIGGDGQSAALASFRIISIVSGLVFVSISALVSSRLFDENTRRVLFLLGLVTGGYMLLFFGYVENYSLFVLSAMIYGLIGLAVALGKMRIWTIIPALFTTILCHIFGVVLIPSAIYLLTRRTHTGRRLSRTSTKTKLLIAVVACIAGGAVFLHFYQSNLFFRFAIVPLIGNRFTAGGYTLFSLDHLIDYANLLIILLPGLPILSLAATHKNWRRQLSQPQNLFLGIFLLSALGAVFIFDPKLGMARDWDLFAVSGIPMGMLLYYWLFDGPHSDALRTKVIVFAILLGAVSLSGRVANVNTADVAVERFRDNLYLDQARGRNAWSLLVEYYRENSDSTMATQIKREWDVAHPERGFYFKAHYLMNNGQIVAATKMLEAIACAYPIYALAWSKLGECLLYKNKLDSAIVCLHIALGLNPHEIYAYNNLGTCYLKMGRPNDALKPLTEALSLSDSVSQIHCNLADTYDMLRDQEKSLYHMSQAVADPDAPLTVVKRVAGKYARLRDYFRAAELYQRALKRGLDSSVVASQIEKHPDLRRYLSEFK